MPYKLSFKESDCAGPFDRNLLLDQLRSSMIVTTIRGISGSGDKCAVVFDDSPPESDIEEARLIISQHSGEPHHVETPLRIVLKNRKVYAVGDSSGDIELVTKG